MPLPFIPLVLLGGSVIAGTKGAVDTFSAFQQITELQEKYNERRAEHEERRAECEQAHNRLDGRLPKLNDLRLHAYDTVKKAAEFLKRAKVKERYFAERIARPHLEQLDNWQGVHVDPIEAFQVVLKAGGAGTATAATVYSTVGTLGVASTGTAISTLSGAAHSAITRWTDCLVRSSCACRVVWCAAATLPHQSCACRFPAMVRSFAHVNCAPTPNHLLLPVAMEVSRGRQPGYARKWLPVGRGQRRGAVRWRVGSGQRGHVPDQAGADPQRE